MSGHPVRVRELAAWGYDAFAYRDAAAGAADGTPTAYEEGDPRLAGHPLLTDERLVRQRSRPDLLLEMAGLRWELGVVDLTRLLAFQRRLSFDAEAPPLPMAASADDAELLRVAFGDAKTVSFSASVAGAQEMVLSSPDPNFCLRFDASGGAPVIAGSGSPFLEVAEYRGRWFLRDGYHRAYHLLRQGIGVAPAVVVRARTLAELGAAQPWFFSEEVLFSASPPRVPDFLDDGLCREYRRPRLTKTIRLTMSASEWLPAQPGDAA